MPVWTSSIKRATGFVRRPTAAAPSPQAVTATVGNLFNGSTVSGVLSSSDAANALRYGYRSMTTTCRTSRLERGGEHALKRLLQVDTATACHLQR